MMTWDQTLGAMLVSGLGDTLKVLPFNKPYVILMSASTRYLLLNYFAAYNNTMYSELLQNRMWLPVKLTNPPFINDQPRLILAPINLV